MTGTLRHWADNPYQARQQRDVHLQLAHDFTTKAAYYKAAATARKEELADLVRREQTSRAKHGNPASKAALESPKTMATLVDLRAAEDPIWKGHVANNQWFIKQSIMESNYATAIQGALDGS